MTTRTVVTCDRPGCGAEFSGPTRDPSRVFIRLPPTGDLGTASWDLCPKCVEELHRTRVEADLSFGDRLRTKETR